MKNKLVLLLAVLLGLTAGGFHYFGYEVYRSRSSTRSIVYNNAVSNEEITHNGLYDMAQSMGIGLI